MNENDVISLLTREKELRLAGIPETEIVRVLRNEFNTIGTPVYDWPPELTGNIDIVDIINPNFVPDSGYPPKPVEPFLSEPAPFHPNIAPAAANQENWVATGARQDSEPSMHNEEGWHGSHIGVSPEFEQTNPNPNDVIYDTLLTEGIKDQDTHLDIDSARTDYLHPDGKLPHVEDGESIELHIHLPSVKEAIANIRHEFKWLTPQYLERVKHVKSDGRFFLIRASGETITDHRGEGEPHRRKLTGDELHAMARTAINHSMDINHYGAEFKTESLVLDSEYDKSRKEIQMLVHESDPEIIRAIDRGDITAVSINGGAPRTSDIECEESECFVVPRGVVLGELDGIALTWVVTNEGGFSWQGHHIPKAEPGVKTTAIQPL